MKANKFGKILGIMSLSVVLMLSAGIDGFAQGKGKGGGGGNGGGNGKGGGGDKHQGGGGKHDAGGGNPGRGNGNGGGNGGGGWKRQMGGWPQQAQPQPQQRQVWQQMPQQVFQARGNGNGNGRGKAKGGNKHEERRVYNAPQVQYRQEDRRGNYARQDRSEWGGGRIPPGQLRKQEVHARNAERKALKQEEKAYRRYDRDNRSFYSQQVPQERVYRTYDRDRENYADRYQYEARRRTYDRSNDQYYYQGPVAPQYNRDYFGYDQNPYQYQSPIYSYSPGYYGYDQDQYGYNEGSSLKQQILRTVISTVLSSFLNRDGGGYGGDDYAYDNNGYDNGYGSFYANGPVRYNTGTIYSRSRSYAPQYYDGYDQPSYSYSSYGQPDYGYDENGYGQYDDYGQRPGGLLGSSALGGLLGQGGRGGFLTQIFGQVLAQGYLQGLLEGQAAKEYGYDDERYYDPYASEEGIYDPFSTTIGQNRRLMSEGYGLGYEDALAGREQFDPEEVGSVDLVSLLLGNVFRFA